MKENLRLYRCCFAGHRPEKLTRPHEETRRELDSMITWAVSRGYRTFISGMARGVDLWAAETVLERRCQYPHLHLICASPFPGFERSWDAVWQKRYHSVMEQADLIHYVNPAYSPGCFQRRNEWMINHSACLICVWNGQLSGTYNAPRYAQKSGLLCRSIQG